jgi:hypothetical protein
MAEFWIRTLTSNRSPTRVGALPRARRLAVYWLSFGVWITGAVWLYFKYFVRVTDEFGFENAHPQQGLWLMAHAFIAVATSWIFGVLWPVHVKGGWKKHLRRPSGGTLWGITVWLMLSGCALYYIGNEAFRWWKSILHWTIGLGALVVFLIHFRSGAKTAHDTTHSN